MPDEMTPEIAQKLLDGITEGPWRSLCLGSEGHVVRSETVKRGGRVAVCTDAPFEAGKADAALIAAAPTLAKAYVDAMAKLDRYRDALRVQTEETIAVAQRSPQRLTELQLEAVTTERDAAVKRAEETEQESVKYKRACELLERVRRMCENTAPADSRHDKLPWDYVQEGRHKKAQAILEALGDEA